MRRMLCLILAAMLMLSHGSMGAAVPHVHLGVADDHHAVTDHDGVHGQAAVADAHVDTHDDIGHIAPEENDESDDGVAAHIHLVAGLARVPATDSHPLVAKPIALSHAVTRLLVSREVAPLLEPPTA